MPRHQQQVAPLPRPHTCCSLRFSIASRSHSSCFMSSTAAAAAASTSTGRIASRKRTAYCSMQLRLSDRRANKSCKRRGEGRPACVRGTVTWGIGGGGGDAVASSSSSSSSCCHTDAQAGWRGGVWSCPLSPTCEPVHARSMFHHASCLHLSSPPLNTMYIPIRASTWPSLKQRHSFGTSHTTLTYLVKSVLDPPVRSAPLPGPSSPCCEPAPQQSHPQHHPGWDLAQQQQPHLAQQQHRLLSQHQQSRRHPGPYLAQGSVQQLRDWKLLLWHCWVACRGDRPCGRWGVGEEEGRPCWRLASLPSCLYSTQRSTQRMPIPHRQCTHVPIGDM